MTCDPVSTLDLLKQALTHLAQGQAELAVAPATQAASMDDSLPIAPQILAKAYSQLGQKKAAIAAYKQAAAKYLALPDPSNARLCIEAIEALQRPNPQPLDPIPLDPAIAQQFLTQAMEKLDREEFRNALQDVQWLLQLEPRHPQALALFALLQAKLGNGSIASTAITRALETDPQNFDLRFQRGLVRLALQDGAGAIQDFTDLLQIHAKPSHETIAPIDRERYAQCYLQRGQGYLLLHNFDNAFKDASNAIAIAPDRPEGYALRANIHQATEDYAAALQDYQQAAALWFNLGNWKNQDKMKAQATIARAHLDRKKP